MPDGDQIRDATQIEPAFQSPKIVLLDREETPVPSSNLEARRKLRTVQSLQILSVTPSRALNDICEVLTRTLRCEIGFVLLSDKAQFTTIGRYGTDPQRFASDLADKVGSAGRIVESIDPYASMSRQDHPLSNGPIDHIVSSFHTPICYDGQTVGILVAASRDRIDPLTESERRILLRLARVANATIKAEVTLKRLAADAFRALERIRNEEV